MNTVRLRHLVQSLYQTDGVHLAFHGWHHIEFVSKKAKQFAVPLGADVDVVEASALVHDLNYLVRTNSEPDAGAVLRASLLEKAGCDTTLAARIESIVREAHLGDRAEFICQEAKALSDADTLFKALPITPVFLAKGFLSENSVSIQELAHKIISEQAPLIENGTYFYSIPAKRDYMHWAKTNVELWSNIREAIQDEEIACLLKAVMD